MGRLSARLLAATVLGVLVLGGLPSRAVAFTGFGELSAEASYGEEMTFGVELNGGSPEQLELLLRFSGDDGTFVAPVQPSGSSAQYVWDAADRHVTPNTTIRYSWRATSGATQELSREQELVYDDDRFSWSSARLGEATVHWYGGAEGIARRFGELAADGAAAAEALLDHEMTGPVDIFVYEARDDFFGALGPGAREWTGAATYPGIRTIFMSLEAGPTDYLETTLVHEVTHVVFNDATENPYHEPAKWLNEGLASWSERESADQERSLVAFEAAGGGLFAFEAISEQFPIGDRGSRLAYAQGATMVDMIIDEHGRDAIARIAATYRDGASDAEALQAGTGVSAEQLYDAFFTEFAADAPEPVEPAPIPPSNVDKPGESGSGSDDGQAPASPRANGDGSPSATDRTLAPWLVVAGIAIVGVAVVVGLITVSARARRRA